jgi:hypothetical protein
MSIETRSFGHLANKVERCAGSSRAAQRFALVDSKEHLPRYCDEFSFRWNNRQLDSGERFVAALKTAEGKRLMCRRPKNLSDGGCP